MSNSQEKDIPVVKKIVTKDEPESLTFLRRVIVLALVIFVLSLGLPLWFNTTTIYRAELPLDEISHLSHDFQKELNFHIPVYVDIPNSIISPAQQQIDSKIQNDYPQLVGLWNIELKQALDSIDSSKDYLVKLEKHQDPAATSDSYSVSPFNKETILYAVDGSSQIDQLLTTVLIEHVFKEELEMFVRVIDGSTTGESTDIDVAMPYSSQYNVVFSLFTEAGSPIDWQIEKVSKLFNPILENLNHFANFSISTQVQYYSKLTFEPTYDEERQVYEVQEDELSTFINFGDWNLISHDIKPTINFLTYFPESNYKGKPLLIKNSETNSFLVPQWGGVYIFNKGMPILEGRNIGLLESELIPIMEIFVSQLFHLLGMTSTPKSPLIRIDTLSRVTTFKNLRQSLENLQSLVKLTESLDGISIPESTKKYVELTVEFIHKSIQEASENHNFHKSIDYSSRGVEYSDKAFFEKEMVQQTYFPQEHKLAVYLPLLGPLLSILSIGVFKTLKDMKSDKKKVKVE
ncbi:GPI transamidase component Gpi17p [[Candida] anglica]